IIMKKLRIYWLAIRMLSLWAWVSMRLSLRIKTSKNLWRRWYNLLSQLTQLIFGELRFMNYGYLGEQEPPLPLTEEERPDARQARMYQLAATLGDKQSTKDLRILEVGSGRGGGAAWMARHLNAAEVVGVDFSPSNVAACQDHFGDISSLSFKVGDAEALPFSDDSFDLVVNVESSHCYPNFPAFLREARRVLRSDGVLAMVDFRLADRLNAWDEDIASGPMKLMQREDITASVLRALDADHNRKVETIESSGAPGMLIPMLKQFTGCRGSGIYNSFVDKGRTYLFFCLRAS
ncbi:MAG: class I SAM-dependent methyltransferase, partial [Myxococcota bacterium]